METFSKLGFTASRARDINDRGQVVGRVNGNGPQARAFLLSDNGTVTVLDSQNESYAFAVNDASPVQIAGLSRNPSSGEFHAVLWTVSENGTVQTLDLGAAGFGIGITDPPTRVVGNGRLGAVVWAVGEDGTSVTSVSLGGASGGNDITSVKGGLELLVVGTEADGVGENRTIRATLWRVAKPIN